MVRKFRRIIGGTESADEDKVSRAASGCKDITVRDLWWSEGALPCPQELYGNVPRIRTPRIIWAHTGRRVLCMEWIDGVKLTDKEAMAAAGLDIVDFVDVGIECTLRQLLESGLFHADPHP